nr:hypothetical protein CFP56_00075 [Quercus suber]
MKGCADEALALMITGRRQWQRESERCTDDALALMKGCTDAWLKLMPRQEGQDASLIEIDAWLTQYKLL